MTSLRFAAGGEAKGADAALAGEREVAGVVAVTGLMGAASLQTTGRARGA